MKISFRKARNEEDIELFCNWVKQPHIKKFWSTDEKEAREKITRRVKTNDVVKPFFILIDKKPIGYIQYYNTIHADDFRKNEPIGTYGIDVFIGEEDYINKGYGTKMIKKFCEFMFKNIKDCIKIIVDPYINNERAIRCYEKVGFNKTEIKTDLEGKKVLIMEIFK